MPQWQYALTVEERIHLLRRSRQSGGSLPKGTLPPIATRRQLSPKKLLASEISDPIAVEQLTPIAELLADLPPPAWDEEFRACYRTADRKQPAFAPSEFALCDALWPLVITVADDVREYLARGGGMAVDADHVLETAKRSLYDRLFDALAKTMVVELAAAQASDSLPGTSPADRFAFFLDCLRDPHFSRRILEQYPVLVRQAMTLAQDWRDSLLEFLERLTEDREEIKGVIFDGRDPGRLRAVQLETGDRHNHGRAVAIAEFENRTKLVYKPKSLALDRHFAALVDWMNARSADLHLATCAVIDKGSYGWSEFVRPRSCKKVRDVKEFYRRQGANLALLYMCGANDFHSENVIADGATPKLIDFETVIHPSLIVSRSLEKSAQGDFEYSVLRTGLLPQPRELIPPEEWLDLSGLGNDGKQQVPFDVPLWDDMNTDQMRLVPRRPTIKSDPNQPVLRGKRVGPLGSVDEIVSGFGSFYRLLCSHRQALLASEGPFRSFKGAKSRVVVRPTQEYAWLLEDSFHPKYLSDALAKDALFDRLRERADEIPLVARVISAERRDLWRGDVPTFSTLTDSRDLWTSAGTLIRGAFEQSGYDAALQRIAGLGDADLDHQIHLIRASLRSAEPADLPAAR